jgi:hypothetical protein
MTLATSYNQSNQYRYNQSNQCSNCRAIAGSALWLWSFSLRNRATVGRVMVLCPEQ